MEKVYIPIKYYNIYDGAVFWVAKREDIVINDGDSIDDLEFDVEDVFFLSPDEKGLQIDIQLVIYFPIKILYRYLKEKI